MTEVDPHSKKYDRQLRLWGKRGQEALEGCKVCLVNSSATGTEALKNLVLPGIQSFTVVDNELVTQRDLGNNFFVDESYLGKPRAIAVTELLKELNGSVQGRYVQEDPAEVIESNPEFFSEFTLVIASNIREKSAIALSKVCAAKEIPLLLCKSYGLVGYLRLQAAEHSIVELKPDNTIEDLRVAKPFPALRSAANALNFDDMTDDEYKHIPFPLLLIKLLDTWEEQHGALPSTRQEKDAFQAGIRTQCRLSKIEEESNWDEAIQGALKHVNPPSIPSDIKKLFEDEHCTNLHSTSDVFWILVAALKRFVDEEGNLPLSGSIPDMASDSKSYVHLQNLYLTKSSEDCDTVAKHVEAIVSECGAAVKITLEETKLLCKNAANLTVLRYRTIADEYENPGKNGLGVVFDMCGNVPWYLMMRAVEKFCETHNRYPGHFEDEMETDTIQLKAVVASLVSDMGLDLKVDDDVVQETSRFGAAELHNIASLVGGVVAQEAIKLVTHQFQPVNNTFIFNGIQGTSLTMEV